MAITRLTGADNSTLTWATIAPAAGDLFVLVFANDGGDNQSTPADLTRLDTDNGTTVEAGLYYRICTGAESGTLIADEGSFGVTGEEYCWHSFKIPAAEWHGITPPEATKSGGAGTTGTIDPPNVAPSWGSETDNLWLVAAARDDDDGISSLSANYTTNFGYVESAASTGSCEIASSWRTNTASSENPGTATQTNTDEEYIAYTVAVRPTATVPVINAIGDGSEPDTRTGVIITGVGFGASETGSAKVEISDNATYGAGTVVEIDATSWSAFSVTVTLLRESDSAPLSTLLSLPLSPAYLWVTNSTGSRNATGFQFVLKPAGATWMDDLNTSVEIDVSSGNVQKRVRIQVDNDGADQTTPSFKFRYSHNGGAYADITSSSTYIQTAATSFFADGDDLTEALIGATALLTNNNAAEESTGTFSMGDNFTEGSDIEAELSFVVIKDDVADADTIDIRLYRSDGTALDTYTQTPRITIVKDEGLVTASGTPDAGSSEAEGDADVLVVAAGSPDAQSSATDAEADVLVEASGSPDAGSSTTDAETDVLVTASGDPVSDDSDVNVDLDIVVTATGAADADQSDVDADAVVIVTITASPEAQSSEVDASATVQVVITGDILSEVADTDAEVDVIVIVNGAAESGAATVSGMLDIGFWRAYLEAGQSEVAGDAEVLVTATGDAEADVADLDAETDVLVEATGDADAQSSTTAAETDVLVEASGDPAADDSDVAVSLIILVTLDADLVSGASEAAGAADVVVTINGDIEAGASETSGSVEVPTANAAGTIEAGSSTVSGTMTVLVVVDGAVVAQSPDVDFSFPELQNAGRGSSGSVALPEFYERRRALPPGRPEGE